MKNTFLIAVDWFCCLNIHAFIKAASEGNKVGGMLS